MNHPTAVPDCGCPDRAPVAATRRGVLRGAALAGATMAFGSTIVTMDSRREADAATPARSVVVLLSLRGAA
ncbi:hypothetical protein ACFP8W_14055, partial [Nocardioides hankookensis]